MLAIPVTTTQNGYVQATTFLVQGRITSGFLTNTSGANAYFLQLYTQPADTGYNPQPLPEFQVAASTTINIGQGGLPLAGVAVRSAVAGSPAIISGALFEESDPQVVIV